MQNMFIRVKSYKDNFISYILCNDFLPKHYPIENELMEK